MCKLEHFGYCVQEKMPHGSKPLNSHVYWDTMYYDMVIPAVRTVVLKLAGLSQSLCNPKYEILFDKYLYYLNKFKQFWDPV